MCNPILPRGNAKESLYLTISCNKKNTEIEDYKNKPEDSRTYTIMMYGCGGGNLDRAMIMNIQEALLAGSSDRVKFTGQVKFSARFQDTEAFKGTQRFVVGSENGTWYIPKEILDSKLELYNPQNLTDFINWSKKECPADDYILLLWNHGSAWTPEKDAPDTRAIVHDDNLDKRGMLEVVTGIRDCAEYVLCASHVTPDMGGDYNSLIYHLNNSTDFEVAMSKFCHEAVSHWDCLDMSLDLTLVNLSKMDKLLKEIKVLSGYMEEAAKITSKVSNNQNNEEYSNEYNIAKAFKDAINKSYHYIWIYNDDGVSRYPFYDI